MLSLQCIPCIFQLISAYETTFEEADVLVSSIVSNRLNVYDKVGGWIIQFVSFLLLYFLSLNHYQYNLLIFLNNLQVKFIKCCQLVFKSPEYNLNELLLNNVTLHLWHC